MEFFFNSKKIVKQNRVVRQNGTILIFSLCMIYKWIRTYLHFLKFQFRVVRLTGRHNVDIRQRGRHNVDIRQIGRHGVDINLTGRHNADTRLTGRHNQLHISYIMLFKREIAIMHSSCFFTSKLCRHFINFMF